MITVTQELTTMERVYFVDQGNDTWEWYSPSRYVVHLRRYNRSSHRALRLPEERLTQARRSLSS